LKPSKDDPLVETIGVVLALAGLTGLLIGLVAFGITGTWRNAASIAIAPTGAILLAGSAFITPRLAAALLTPAGVMALGVAGLTYGRDSALATRIGAKVPMLPHYIMAIAGGACIVASLLLALPRLLRRKTLRRDLTGANAALMCLLALALLVTVNYIASRWYKRHDVTRQATFSLSPRSIDIIKSLPEKIEITCVLGPKEPVALDIGGQRVPVPGIYERTHDMLDDYKTISGGKISVRYIDPIDEPEQAAQFSGTRGVFFGSPARSVVVPVGQLVDQSDLRAVQMGKDPGYLGEEEFTSALVHVTDAKKTKVYVTAGNDELPLDSLPLFSKTLQANYCEAKTLRGLRVIPKDCDMLVVLGPKRPFSEEEAERLAEYLQNDGKLLIALEPLAKDVQQSGLEDVLAQWGIMMRRELVVLDRELEVIDPQAARRFRSWAKVAGMHPRNEITGSMSQLWTLFSFSSAMELMAAPAKDIDGNPVPPRYRVAPITITSQYGKAKYDRNSPETFDKDRDLPGPVIMAACSQKTNTRPAPDAWSRGGGKQEEFDGTRIVATGDADLFTDASISAGGPGNPDFVAKCVAWLMKKPPKLGIPPKALQAEPVAFTVGESSAIFFSTLFGLPYLALMIGGIIYWRRTR